MVGKVFRVLFARNAQRRRKIIDDFETRKSGKQRATKVQQAIDEAADRLEKLPKANPHYLIDGKKSGYRYSKALGYKVIFKIFPKVGDVLIITIRHDNEDPGEVEKDIL